MRLTRDFSDWLLFALAAYISAGLIINIENILVGRVIAKEVHFLILSVLVGVLAVVVKGKFAKNPLPLLAFTLCIWGLGSMLIQDIISDSNTWLGRALTYLQPFVLLGFTAMLPNAPQNKNRFFATLAILWVAILIGTGIAQWYLQAPLVWTGEKDGAWYPWVWRAGDPLTGEIIVRAFSFFYTPVQYGGFCTAIAMVLFASVPKQWWSWKGIGLTALALGALLGVYASSNRTAVLGAVMGVLSVVLIHLFPRLLRRFPAIIASAYLILSMTLIFAAPLISIPNLGNGVLLDNRNLSIRLDDFSYLFNRWVSAPDQLLYGVRDLARLLTPLGVRPDLANFVPVDNESLFLGLQFGLPGVILMTMIIYQLAREAEKSWASRRNVYGLGLLCFLVAWAFGAPFNVVYIYFLPIACFLFILSRPAIKKAKYLT